LQELDAFLDVILIGRGMHFNTSQDVHQLGAPFGGLTVEKLGINPASSLSTYIASILS